MRPFSHKLDQLQTIPCLARAVAEVIVAETGADMSPFPSPGHLASWAGVCPGHHESAGKRGNQAGPVTATGGCAPPWAPPPWPRP